LNHTEYISEETLIEVSTAGSAPVARTMESVVCMVIVATTMFTLPFAKVG
jgi:hypothetical protein